MEALQNRVDSFLKQKRVKHRNKMKYIKWPHPLTHKANPQTLAEAGFYYNPSHDAKDNVKCYICNKELDDWAEEDDPFDIHWEKCAKTCAWAVVRCGLRTDMDTHGRFTFQDKTRLPSSKAMEKARLATFNTGGWWPHDEDPSHGATSSKMAMAGFIYCPQYSGDDLVTCLYCSVSLSGWDKDDNPLEEHQKRVQKSDVPCPFFATQVSKPPSRTASTSRSKDTSKPSSRTIEPAVEPKRTEQVTKPRATTSRRKTKARATSTKPIKTSVSVKTVEVTDKASTHDDPAAVLLEDPPEPGPLQDIPAATVPEEPMEEPVVDPLSVTPESTDPASVQGAQENENSITPNPQVPPIRPSPEPIRIIQRSNSSNDMEATLAEPNPFDIVPTHSSTQPPFHPPLAKLPFQYLEALTEVELDMTVEEWIRYQIGIEFEKFKRDGERELMRFKQRAEEARRAIEAS